MMQTRRTSSAVEKTTTSRRHKRTASAASFDPAEEVEEPQDQEEVDADAAPQKRRKTSRKSTTKKTTKLTKHEAPSSSQPAVVIEHHHSSHKIRLSDADAAAAGDELQISTRGVTFGEREDFREIHELEIKHKIEEKDEQIDRLTEDVEAQRQHAIDLGIDEPVEVEHLVAELAQRNRERIILSSALTEIADITYPVLPHVDADETMLESTELSTNGNVTRPLTATEREETLIGELETKIIRATQELADLTAQSELQSTELNALGFAQGRALDVLSSIRTSFHTARLTAEVILQENFEHLGNQMFLEMLTNRVGFLKAQLSTVQFKLQQQSVAHDAVVEKYDTLVEKHDSSVDELEILQQTIIEEKQGLADARVEMSKLEEELEAALTTVDQYEAQITELSQENAQVKLSNDRLKKAMDNYMDERRNLERVIEKMEIDHASVIERLKSEHAAELAEMQEKLDGEAYMRGINEEELHDKQGMITGLEIAVEQSERKVDALKVKIGNLQDAFKTKDKVHAAGIAALQDEKAQTEQDLLAAEEEVTAQKDEIAQLQEALDAEQAQVESTSVENQALLAQVAQLNTKVHELGLEGNKLREKLYQSQLKLQEEVQRREEVEAEVAELQITVTNLTKEVALQISNREALQQQITGLRTELDEAGDAREASDRQKEAEIDALEAQVTDKTDVVTALQLRLQEATESYDLAMQQSQERIEDLENTVEERNQALAASENANADLQEKLDEAEQSLVDIQQGHEQERKEQDAVITEQAATIAEQAATITELNRVKEATVTEHTETVTEMTRKSEALAAHAERQEAYIGRLEADVANLQGQIERMRQTFREEVKDDVDTRKKIQDQLAETMAKLQDEYDAKGHRQQIRFAKVESFDTTNLESNQLMTPEASQAYVQGGAEEMADKVTFKTKKTRAKKVAKKSSAFRDSGFGAEEMELE